MSAEGALPVECGTAPRGQVVSILVALGQHLCSVALAPIGPGISLVSIGITLVSSGEDVLRGRHTVGRCRLSGRQCHLATLY